MRIKLVKEWNHNRSGLEMEVPPELAIPLIREGKAIELKPAVCTCSYAEVIARNMNGHNKTCPIYQEWAAWAGVEG